MIRIYLAVISFFLTAVAYGNRLVVDKRTWDTRTTNSYYSVFLGIKNWFPVTYHLDGDTLVGNHNALRLTAFDNHDPSRTEYLAALYEEEGKIYFIPAGHQDSWLMYDFTANVGDTVRVYQCPLLGDGGQWKPKISELMAVDEKTYLEQGIERRALLMYKLDNGGWHDENVHDFGPMDGGWWIDGIGSEAGVAWNCQFTVYGISHRLESVWQEDMLLYKCEEPDYYRMVDGGMTWTEAHSYSSTTADVGKTVFFFKMEQPGRNGSRVLYVRDGAADGMEEHAVAELYEETDYEGIPTRRVMMYPSKAAQNSVLLYDFGASEGDILEVASIMPDDDYTIEHKIVMRRCRVDSVRSKEVEGRTRRHVFITAADSDGKFTDGNSVCWIEGIGCVYGLGWGGYFSIGQHGTPVLVKCHWESDAFYLSEAFAEDYATADVNQDNTVDISDIVAVINVIAGTDSNDKADVNADGKTDISDIVAIINSIAK